MQIAIVAYPALEAGDREWIESIRSAHDPQAARIGVHFTLVFPVAALPGDLTAELTVVAASIKPISFAIRRTQIVVDVVNGGAQIFLVPDEGADRITELHDRLYAGALRKHLRADIPSAPHMTIAAAPDSHSCEQLAGQFGLGSRVITGEISAFELVDVSQPRVTLIRTYALNS